MRTNTRQKVLKLIAVSGLLPLTYNACSGQKFNAINESVSIPLVAKASVVSSKRFDSNNRAYAAANGDVSNLTELPVQTVVTPVTSVTTEIPMPDPSSPVPPALTPTTFAASWACSNAGTAATGGNLTTLKAAGGNVKVVVTSKVSESYNAHFTAAQRGYGTGTKICEITSPTMLKEIMDTKQISVLLHDCVLESATTYSFFLVDEAKSASQLENGQGVFARWSNVGTKAGAAAAGASGSGVMSTPVVLFKNNIASENALCDMAASPLAILLENEGQSRITLSSLTNGIMFDILGQSNNHSKMEISWLRQSNLYWVVRPNANGEVKGIDQLFGNNTTGPDGLLAENGYEALAKYDGMDVNGQNRIDAADGLITSSDPVFEELRLWNDSNRDGIAQAYELLPLREKGIVAIDLRFDGNYSEVDRYGNKILMKSVVQMASGDLQPIFDIWFRTF